MQGWFLVLIKSLINYLVDQKFSGPLLLHQASIAPKPLKLNTQTFTQTPTGARNTQAKYTRATNVYMHLLTQRKTHTDFDEAKLEYKGGGGWLVCCL